MFGRKREYQIEPHKLTGLRCCSGCLYMNWDRDLPSKAIEIDMVPGIFGGSYGIRHE